MRDRDSHKAKRYEIRFHVLKILEHLARQRNKRGHKNDLGAKTIHWPTATAVQWCIDRVTQ